MTKGKELKESQILQTGILLTAVLLSPIALRISFIVESGIDFAFYDLRGIFSDIVVSLFIALAVVLISRLSKWAGIALVAFWSVLNYGSYEHVKVLGALPGLFNATYLVDATFMRGSALSPSSPLLLAGILCASVILAWFALRKPPGKLILLFLMAVVTLGIHMVWPQDYTALAWRQSHFVYENVSWLARRDEKVTTTTVTRGGLEKFLSMDLGGKPLIRLGNSGRNVLLIMLEGVSGAYLESIANIYRIKTQIRMPRLDNVAKRSILFSSFVSHQRQTNRGEYAILCGDYPMLTRGEPKMSTTVYERRNIDCLPGRLKSAGYETVYIQAAPLGFMLKDQFMSQIGFSNIYGDKWFTHSYARNQWGVDDKAYFEQSLDMVRRLHSGNTPWFLAMLTVGTHHPYIVPEDYRSSYGKDSFGRAIAYLDGALDAFLETLKREGILDDTLVIITSDESAGVMDAEDDLAMILSQNLGFAIVITPEHDSMVANNIFGQVDLALSIVDYLGITGKDTTFYGRSIFRKYTTPRTIFFSNVNMGIVSAHDALGYLYMCRDDFMFCNKYSTQGASLFSPLHRKLNFSRKEVDFMANMAAWNGEAHSVQKKTFHLIVDPVVAVSDSYEKQLIFGGQFLTVPPGTRIEIELEVELSGKNGQVALSHDLVSRREGIMFGLRDITMPPLGPGNSISLRYSLDGPQELRDLECRLFVERLWGSEQMKLKIRKAEMKFVPLARSERAEVKNANAEEFSVNGTILDMEQLIDRAIEQYETALQFHKSGSIQIYLAIAYEKKKLFNEAIKYYSAALELAPDSATLHYDLARVYRKQDLIKKADEHMRMAERLEKESNGL